LSFTPPASFFEKQRLPNQQELLRNLRTIEGREFEGEVTKAFNFLDFDAFLTQSTQAESDVIAEAYYAEKPYFIVIECQAVRPQNQVGYDKVGQIRGNAQAYLDTRRQRLFETSHKLIVGKPRFSSDAILRAKPDVSLITVSALSTLLIYHSRFSFSQDELKEILTTIGEISTTSVQTFQQRIQVRRQHLRKLEIYSLVYIALLEDPIRDNLERRKDWASLDVVVGAVKTYGQFFGILNLNDQEIAEVIRDLDNPFLRIVRRRPGATGKFEVRLSTISRAMIHSRNPFGNMLSSRIDFNIRKLRTLVSGPQRTSVPLRRARP